MLHSDCDGIWSHADAVRLEAELKQIGEEFRALPPLKPIPGSWQQRVAEDREMRNDSLYESFFDVDGEPPIERLIQLAQVSQQQERDILFQ